MPSVVKHSYVKGAKTSSKIGAHINYIQYRKDVDRDTGARPFHTDKIDNLTGRELKQSIQDDLSKGDVVHKIIVSPGHNNVDINEYTREVMDELGKAKGQELRYAFVVHENTDHYHAHVILLGRDQEGHRVRLDKLDHLRMRAFGDRYLEREHSIERVLDKDMERFCRDRGLNIMYEKERSEYFYERLYKGDPAKKGDKNRDPERDVREWEKFNDDWRVFIQDREGMERGNLGKSSFHEIGRQADLSQIIHNNEQRKFWEELAENNPDMKDQADKKLAELEQDRREIQEQIDARTKPYDPWKVLEDVAEEFKREDVQLKAVLEGSHSKVMDLDLEQIPESQQIEAGGRIYTKFDSRGDLMDLDEHLNADYENRVPYEKYQMLGSWLTAKEHYGDDCYGPPPMKEREIELELPAEMQNQPKLDRLLGFDDSERSIDELSPLLVTDEPAKDRTEDLDNFLGFAVDRSQAEQSFDIVETYGVPDQSGEEKTDHDRVDDESEHLFEIGW